MMVVMIIHSILRCHLDTLSVYGCIKWLRRTDLNVSSMSNTYYISVVTTRIFVLYHRRSRCGFSKGSGILLPIPIHSIHTILDPPPSPQFWIRPHPHNSGSAPIPTIMDPPPSTQSWIRPSCTILDPPSGEQQQKMF